VAARVLERLWHQGKLTVHRRENFERYFDRTERLLPDAHARHHAGDADALLPAEDEERAYLTRKRLRARRLFRAGREDVAALGKGELVAVTVEGSLRSWQVLVEDADTLAGAESLTVDDEAVNLLAPLDPLVYDRERTRAVFGFDYTWEVYTPQAKRRCGYYVLPVLRGDRLIGRVDPKLDRKTGTLTLASVSLEPGVETDAVAEPLAERLRAFATFLGAERVTVERAEPEGLARRFM
jgi:hypothetical protein